MDQILDAQEAHFYQVLTPDDECAKHGKSMGRSQRDLMAVRRAIPVIEMFRKSVCGYCASTCDCKFGYDGERKGEQTGCPELRIAAGALKDYEAMATRLIELEESINFEEHPHDYQCHHWPQCVV